MAKEAGKVTKIDRGWIEVKIPTGKDCGFCSSKLNCSFQGPDSAYRVQQVPYQSGIDVGDRLTLEIRESAQNISAVVLFGLPIILVLVGILAGKYLSKIPNGEIWGVLAGFVVYGISLYLFNRWFARLPMFIPKIIEVQESENVNKLKIQKIEPILITKMTKPKN